MMPQTEHLSPNAYSREGSGKQIVHIKCLHSTCWIIRLYFTDNIFWLLLGFSSSGGVWWENHSPVKTPEGP